MLSTKIRENMPRYIDGFDIVFPERGGYFGKSSDNTEASPLEKRKASLGQSALFDEEPRLIEISVSDFVLAHKCPKIFNGYFNRGYPLSHPHHKIFDIGTIVDKIAKEYLRLPPEIRSKKQPLFRDQLANRITKFSLNDSKSRELLNAFDDFCTFFKAVKLSNTFNSNKKLIFQFGEFLLSGRIDFLIHEQDNTLTLLDLKLLSVGSSVDNLQFYDFLQAILYAYALLSNKIKVGRMGYYYFLERAFVIQKFLAQDFEKIIHTLQEFASSLSRTKEFIPRRCAYCLICQLRQNCEVGSQTTRNDFTNPLE